MKLDRKQQTALGVLALATVALVADRTVLSPQSAVASTAQGGAVVDLIAPAVKTINSPESVSANLRVVSQRVEPVGPQLPTTDPFAWRLPQTETEPVALIRSFEDVTDSWSVSAIVGTAESRLAVINGRAVRVNESLTFSPTDPRQVKVVEIREERVVLYHNGQTATLYLPTTTLSGVD